MFSKAKRFDEKPVGCGADAVYNPVAPSKMIGGVIPKVDRFHDLKCPSDAESVHSDKSSQVFRTPKAIRRVPNTPKKALTSQIDQKALLEELLSAKTVEISNKDETIKEYECQINELNNKVYDLEGELASLKISCENVSSVVVVSDDGVHSTEDGERLVSKASDLVAAEKERLESEIESMKVEIKTMEEAKRTAEENAKSLLEEMDFIEKKINNICSENVVADCDDDTASVADKIDRLKRFIEGNSKKLREMEKAKALLRERNNELKESLKNARTEYENQLSRVESNFSNEIKHLNENALEKLRICEIQFEERYQDFQSYSNMQLNKEINKRHDELQICQEICEKEIMRYELQVADLKRDLDSNNNRLSELSRTIEQLRTDNKNKSDLINQLENDLKSTENAISAQKDKYEDRIEELNFAVEKLTKDKKLFSHALDSTHKAAAVLTARLKNADDSVELFKTKLEDALKLKGAYETELLDLQVEYGSFKDEYKQLLVWIVNSKSTLDKSHKEILDNNAKIMDSLEETKSELTKNITGIKEELSNDVETYKRRAQTVVADLENRLEAERGTFIEMKTKCDEAYSKIDQCKHLLAAVEGQLEIKDQELNEMGTENDRLSGTLAAYEQEKNELQLLLKEFVKLAEGKDAKIYEYLKKIEEYEDVIREYDGKTKKLTQFLEATEFIVKEKEREMTLVVDNIKTDMNQLSAQNKQLTEKIEKDSSRVAELDDLQKRHDNLEKELAEMTNKYTDLLGHHNYKQKIKHIIDLKAQRNALKEENERMTETIQKQNLQIEKLKRDLECANILKSPLLSKKQILHAQSPHGKENLGSPVSHSPNRAENPRALTPLRDLNR